jgi:SAM-dependent methyltransferase
LEARHFPPTNWWDIPTVRERWNRLVSGDSRVDYNAYVSHKYLSVQALLTPLSLGCGTGHQELRWVELGNLKRVDAYDLSKTRIEYTQAQARDKGCGEVIHYAVGDVYRIEIRNCHYGVVLAEQALHHLSPLAPLPLGEISLRINDCLRPDGYLIVNDCVGPTRFQWTNRQMQAVNGLLSILPCRYRLQWDSTAVKSRIFRPGRLRMIVNDPSGAVESSRILPLLRRIFQVVELRGYGASVLHPLLTGIAHHFLKEDQETGRFLALCFQAEDDLLASGDLQDDFIAVILPANQHKILPRSSRTKSSTRPTC